MNPAGFRNSRLSDNRIPVKLLLVVAVLLYPLQLSRVHIVHQQFPVFPPVFARTCARARLRMQHARGRVLVPLFCFFLQMREWDLLLAEDVASIRHPKMGKQPFAWGLRPGFGCAWGLEGAQVIAGRPLRRVLNWRNALLLFPRRVHCHYSLRAPNIHAFSLYSKVELTGIHHSLRLLRRYGAPNKKIVSRRCLGPCGRRGYILIYIRLACRLPSVIELNIDLVQMCLCFWVLLTIFEANLALKYILLIV